MRIGIDLGGTKIEGLLLNEHGAPCRKRRVPTPRNDYPATVDAVCRLVEEIEGEDGRPGSVGVGIPGTISPVTGLVKNANSTWLIGHPLQRDLSRQLNRVVRVANDADCFTVSEATDGAGEGAVSVFGVILGTGVGGGLCWRGDLVQGPNGITGEWGHNPLPWAHESERPGPECYCGRRGCLETFLSGPALHREWHILGGGEDPLQTIGEQARQPGSSADQALSRYEDRLARGLAHIINIFDPEVIVLGGGVSNITRLYQRVPELWGQWVFSDRVETRLVPAKHGDSSGVRGAAWLWPLNAKG